jgi:uncharacterized membrane protein
MIIMALDHVRDLIHVNAAQNPTDLATTSPWLFFTRWITHLCAPVFVFLAGVSVYIYLSQKKDVSQTRKFLLTRGFWLILLEFSVVNFGLFFDAGFHTLLFEVIAAIGVGFIVLSLLLDFSFKTIGIMGAILVGCHNLLPLIPFGQGSQIKTILQPLFAPGAFPITSRAIFIMGYPPVPWLGIMLLGFAAGRLFEFPAKSRIKKFQQIGWGALLLFVVLRLINVYGDPLPWSSQKDGLYTFLSFINVTKYPPSLLFCLITLGVQFLILAIAERSKGNWMKHAMVYGRVPLFYFLLHFYLIHVTLLIILFLQGFSWSQLDFASGSFGRPRGVPSGVPLWAVYVIWLVIVGVLYKPCLWFSHYKATHQHWWLKYI